MSEDNSDLKNAEDNAEYYLCIIDMLIIHNKLTLSQAIEQLTISREHSEIIIDAYYKSKYG